MKCSLIEAIKEGNIDLVKMLVDQGANVNPHVLRWMDNPLHVAVHENQYDIVEYLIKEGANLKFYSHGFTVLHDAAERGDVAMVNLLLDHGALPNIDDRPIHFGKTPLCYAIENNNKEVISLLLDRGANPNLGTPTAFEIAVENENIELINLLFDKGAIPNNHLVVHCENYESTEIAELLYQRGCVDLTDTRPLAYIIATGNENLVRWFIDKGANLNAVFDVDSDTSSLEKLNSSPIFSAIINNEIRITKLLIENGANDIGLTKLQIAIVTNNHESIKELLDEDLTLLQEVDDIGIPVIYYASISANVETLDLLNKYGVDWSHSIEPISYYIYDNQLVCTPAYSDYYIYDNSLHCTPAYNDLNALKWMVEHTKNINHQSPDGATILTIVKDDPEKVNYLLEQGADPNITDGNGNTALHLLVHGCYEIEPCVEVAKSLIQHGANLNIINFSGQSPRDIYNKYKFVDSAELKALLNSENHSTRDVISSNDVFLSEEDVSFVTEDSVSPLQEVLVPEYVSETIPDTANNFLHWG